MTEKLEPCPFCSGPANIWTYPCAPHFLTYQHTDGCPLSGWTGTYFSTHEEAVKACNTQSAKHPRYCTAR